MRRASDVGDVLLDVFLEFGGVGSVGSVDDLALHGDEHLGFASGVQIRNGQRFYFLLIQQDDVDALLELVDDVRLQVFVERHEGFTVSAPRRVHVDYEQFGVLIVVVGQKVLGVADHRRQLRFFGRHYLRFKLQVSKNQCLNPHRRLIHLHCGLRGGEKEFNYIMSLIKYLGLGKVSSGMPVVDYLVEKEQEERIKSEVLKVIEILKDTKIEFQDKQRVKSEFGSWHCKKDEKGMLYLLLTEADLPERHVYTVLAQLRSHLSILPDYQNQADDTLIEHSQTAITQICQNFNTENQQTYRSTNQYQLKRGKFIRSSTLTPRKTINNMTNAERKSQMQRLNAQFTEADRPERPDRLCLNWKSNLFRGAVMVILLAAIILPIVLIVGKRV